MNAEWRKKLSSRKFWVAVSAFAVALCVLFGVDVLTVEKLTATISALGVLMAYIFTEGYLDGQSIKEEAKAENNDEENK